MMVTSALCNLEFNLLSNEQNGRMNSQTIPWRFVERLFTSVLILYLMRILDV